MKEKARPANAEERRHWARLAELPCAACKRTTDITIHHVTSDGYKRIGKDHKLVVPLCRWCHQNVWNSKTSVEALGHRKFNELHGIDLLQIATDLWRETNGN